MHRVIGKISFVFLALFSIQNLNAEEAPGAPPADPAIAPAPQEPAAVAAPPAEVVLPPPQQVVEETDPAPVPAPRKKASKKRRGRKIASAEISDRYSDVEASRSFRSNNPKWELRLSALLGTSTQSGRAADPALTNILLGLNADLRFLKYFGAEIDIHGDALTSSSTDKSVTESRQQRGGVFNVKGQYPFWTKSIRWIPKLGLGYGYHQTDAAVVSTSKVETATTVKGAVFVLGFDVEPVPKLVLGIDYARTLSASALLSTTAAPPNQNFSDTSLDRLRLGGFYRFGRAWGAGAQFVRRSTSVPNGNAAIVGAATGSQSSLQAQGVFVYELQ